MAKQTNTSKKRKYTFVSPGDGAYQLQVIGRAEGDKASFVLTGTGDRHTEVLLPGKYAVRLTHLTDSREEANRSELALTARSDTVLLEEHFDVGELKDRSMPRTRISQSDLLSAVRHTKWNTVRTYSVSERMSDPTGREFINHIPIDARIDRLADELRVSDNQSRISVGLSSNDSRSKSSGWKPETDLEIETISTQTEILHFRLNARHQIRNDQSRVRMTVSLHGRPALRLPVPLFAGGIEITLTPVITGELVDIMVEIRAVDSRIQAIVRSLSELDSEDALAVLQWASGASSHAAIQVLAEKKEDLWAATVAALSLVRSYEIQEVATWAYNLARLAPHISDASVAAAWACAAAAENQSMAHLERDILGHLVRARRAGAPTFLASQSIALELLNGLRSGSETADIRRGASREISIWSKRAQRRIFSGAYFMWEQAGSDLQRGVLPRSHYAIAFEGGLGPDGFTEQAIKLKY